MIASLSRLSIPLPSTVRLPTPSTRTSALLLIGILPVAAPTVYLLYLRLTTVRHITSSTGRYHPAAPIDKKSGSKPQSPSSPEPPHPPLPLSIPAHLPTSPSHIIMYERVTSHAIPLSSLSLNDATSSADQSNNIPPALLTTYLRTTMKAFSRTPQAYLIRSALKGNSASTTFDDSCIDALEFVPGDRVNGVYVVTYRGEGRGGDVACLGERVEMKLDVPEGYTGAGNEVEGMIIAGVEGLGGGAGEREGEWEVGSILLFNETWLWRGEGGKPVMLESVVGRWLHGLLAGWLVVKGMRAVTI
ncbi:hypothetical protein ACJ72_05859 [Emergomyces africanus]|uniref:Uncharacterized protein n=1 Tax=Emergomyces africanus TaxID=1955775 RepID=A0A1B7NSS1_9EURO|nr:hypothetical protein ACJ72_05859 [Emergomyces africanus]